MNLPRWLLPPLAVILLGIAPPPLFTRLGVAEILSHTPQLRQCAGRFGLACYAVRGTSVGGFINPASEDDGFLANDREVLVIPLISGGSGGVFDALLYTRSGTGAFRFVGYVPSPQGHLLIYLNGGRIIVRTPIYKSGDAECCPSSEHWKIYTLNGIRLVLLVAY